MLHSAVSSDAPLSGLLKLLVYLSPRRDRLGSPWKFSPTFVSLLSRLLPSFFFPTTAGVAVFSRAHRALRGPSPAFCPWPCKHRLPQLVPGWTPFSHNSSLGPSLTKLTDYLSLAIVF